MGLLAVLAFLALANIDTSVGLWAHLVPAGAIYSVLNGLGLQISPHGAFLRSAHGPPFLGPIGIVLVYVVPAVIFGAIAARTTTRATR